MDALYSGDYSAIKNKSQPGVDADRAGTAV